MPALLTKMYQRALNKDLSVFEIKVCINQRVCVMVTWSHYLSCINRD